MSENIEVDIAHSPQLVTIKNAIDKLKDDYDVSDSEHYDFLKMVFFALAHRDKDETDMRSTAERAFGHE